MTRARATGARATGARATGARAAGTDPAGADGPGGGAGRPTQRLDKWLWQARFFRTRTLAAQTVADGRVRVNAQRVSKPATAVAAGDTLTFVQGGRVRLIRVRDLASRRGAAPEAQALYIDLDAPPEAPGQTAAPPLD